MMTFFDPCIPGEDYSENTLGLPPFKIAMETRQERHVAFIKKLYFTFPSNTGQSTFKITFTEQGDSYIALNGGADLNLDAQVGFNIDDLVSDWFRAGSNQNQFETFIRIIQISGLQKKEIDWRLTHGWE